MKCIFIRFISLLCAVFLASPTNASLIGLFKNNIERNILIDAAELGNIEYVKYLINTGHNINSIDESGRTALMRASYNGNDQMVGFLISHGANINLTDKIGNTALHFAAMNDHLRVARMLINNGADVKTLNNKGLTPMELAIKHGSIHVVQVIDPGMLSVVETKAGFPIAAAAAGGSGFSAGTMVIAGAGVAAAGAGVAVATGGGGGSSESSSSSSSPRSDDSENESGGNAGGSNGSNSGDEEPGTGEAVFSGILVAIIDTGVDLDHPFFANRIISDGRNFHKGIESGKGDEEGEELSVGQDISSLNFWHGTHVAGVAGVTFNSANAGILPINVYTIKDKAIYSIDVSLGIDYSVSQRARVINLSLGGSSISPLIRNSIFKAVQVSGIDSVVVVAAAGNLYDNGEDIRQDQPLYPARFAGDTDINPKVFGDLGSDGALLAVGAVDGNKEEMAEFSHNCGDAKHWCLVAPGESIQSAVPDGLLATASGTSMSAPSVSGAVAVMMDLFPSLTGRQVAEILLNTAIPLGDDEISPVYGHGLLNLEDAIKPQGEFLLSINGNVNGVFISLDNTNITTSSAFGDAFEVSGLNFSFLDAYKRSYKMNLADVVYQYDSLVSFENMFEHFGNNILDKKQRITPKLSFAIANVVERDSLRKEQEEFTQIAFSSYLDESSLHFHYNVPMNQSYYSIVLSDVGRVANQNMGTPSVLGLVTRGISQNSRYTINKYSEVSFGSFHGKQKYGDVYGVVSELSRKFGIVDIGVQLGMLSEEKSFLGSSTDGAFVISGNTPTWFYNFSGVLPISEKIKLFGSYNYGISFPRVSGNSLLSDISRVDSYAFSAGISKSEIFRRDDAIELVLLQPLRVSRGTARLDLPIGRNLSGNILRGFYDVNLSPSGREIDLGAFYGLDFGKSASMDVGAIYRMQPGHYADAEDDAMFMVKYKLSF